VTNATSWLAALLTVAILLFYEVGLLLVRRRSPARLVLELVLMIILFASLVCLAMAMRYYNHAGFTCAMPVDSEERRRWSATGIVYLRRNREECRPFPENDIPTDPISDASKRCALFFRQVDGTCQGVESERQFFQQPVEFKSATPASRRVSDLRSLRTGNGGVLRIADNQ